MRAAEPLASGRVGAGLLGLGMALLPWVPRTVRRLAPPARGTPAPWGAVAFATWVGVGLLLGPLLAGTVPGEDAFGGLVRTALWLGLLALGIGVLSLRWPRRAGGALGLLPGGQVRASFAAVAGYLLLLPLLHGLSWLWPYVAERFSWEAGPQPVLVELLALEDGRRLAAVGIAVLLGPFLEELLFRGFLQALLVEWLGAGLGLGGTALVFALLHGSHAFLPLLALSLYLGWLQLRTGRLAAPFAVHSLNNALTLALAFQLETIP